MIAMAALVLAEHFLLEETDVYVFQFSNYENRAYLYYEHKLSRIGNTTHVA